MQQTTSEGTYDIRSEAHGPHWVAWAVARGETKPKRSVILIGETKEEAEQRARAWAAALDVSSD